MHPQIASRLRQEILDKVGPTRTPTYDDIRDMKYLRAFINGAYFIFEYCHVDDSLDPFFLSETLRLFPPV